MNAFIRAALFGTLAGAALPLCLSLVYGIEALAGSSHGFDDFLAIFYLMGMPLYAAFLTVVIAGVLVGIPASRFLRRRNTESRGAYIAIGIVAGAVLPALVAMASGWNGFIAACLAALGALSCGLAASRWWRLTHEKAARDRSQAAS